MVRTAGDNDVQMTLQDPLEPFTADSFPAAQLLLRIDVMRIHRDTLVKELFDTGAEFADTKKTRLSAYVIWSAGLAAVIERYKELAKKNNTIPRSEELSEMLLTHLLIS